MSHPIVGMIANMQDIEEYRSLHWTGSFEEYLDIVRQDPSVSRNAYQRLYDLVVSFGTTEYTEYKKKIVRYKFFDDPFDNGKDAVFGIDVHLMKLVNVLRAGAMGYGAEKRVILLHGPVGSAKSTIARLLKKGLEWYSKQPQGRLYTFSWVDADGNEIPSPLNEDPLKLIPLDLRAQVVGELVKDKPPRYPIRLEGDLDPVSRFMYKQIMEEVGGDWTQLIERIRVRRLTLSEKDRVGIGTFQPKDEKNQDSTELTGDINYRKIAEYGSDSDPRAFNFDGEFCVANRGLIEFVEVLKLDVAFLYDLLGASQEHTIKPKKFPQTVIDEVILGHTNEPEYRKLQSNEFMEALRDRTIKIDIPYITKYQQEARIYHRDYAKKAVGRHIAPHTLEMAAMWAVLTRLEQPKKHNLTLVQKLKLYDGKLIPGYTEDNVKELRKSANREGLEGISPRYVQDKISNALVRDPSASSINPFMVLNALESGLKQHSLISDEDQRKHYRDLLGLVKTEYENIIKKEVQKAITADEGAIARLCANYIDNVKAYTQKERVKNPFTGAYEEPDERLMRSIEEKIDIADGRKDDYRREIMNFIGALALDGKTFKYDTNDRLYRALELKLFEDQKDTIRLSSLVSNVIDDDTQKKIDIVKQRLIERFGYDEQSATDVLNYVASIFARGDTQEEGG
ncbi:MAG: serine protein kinase [Myxococcota bacterium]|nr:serine protein kinase [Myxococcota bacterium]